MNDAVIEREAAAYLCRVGLRPLKAVAGALDLEVAVLERIIGSPRSFLARLERHGYEVLTEELERASSEGRRGRDAVASVLNRLIDSSSWLVLPIYHTPPLRDEVAAQSRHRVRSLIEQLLQEGRSDGTVDAAVTATDVLTCIALVTQPGVRAPGSPAATRRHAAAFVNGLGAHPDFTAAPVSAAEIEQQIRDRPHSI